TPMRLQRLATMLDQYGLAQDLLHEKYQNPATIQANLQHIGEVLEHFFAHVPQEDAWRAGQENGLPWGGVRSMDEILTDNHLHDPDFFTDVEHPELGRSFIYPGGATIYHGSPWRLSRACPAHRRAQRRDFLWRTRSAESRVAPPGRIWRDLEAR